MKKLETFFDDDTSTLTYVMYDAKSLEAVIIDPVWDINLASGQLLESKHKRVNDFLHSHSLRPILILETHAHADHLSGASLFKRDYPNIKLAIGENIKRVQSVFASIFNLKDLNTNAEQFDILLKDEEHFCLGSFDITVLHTPGHTPACSSYLIENHLFTGDALFVPDSGTGRCDFPDGSAQELYESIKRIYELDDQILAHPGHDYQPNGREILFEASLAEHKKNNIHLRQETSAQEFVSFRQARDKTLASPRLLLPSLQVNIRAGQLPEAEDNQIVYLKIPVRAI